MWILYGWFWAHFIVCSFTVYLNTWIEIRMSWNTEVFLYPASNYNLLYRSSTCLHSIHFLLHRRISIWLLLYSQIIQIPSLQPSLKNIWGNPFVPNLHCFFLSPSMSDRSYHCPSSCGSILSIHNNVDSDNGSMVFKT